MQSPFSSETVSLVATFMRTILGVVAIAVIHIGGVYMLHTAAPGQSLGAKIESVPFLYASMLASVTAILAAVVAFWASLIKTQADEKQHSLSFRQKKQNAEALALFCAGTVQQQVSQKIKWIENARIVSVDEDGEEIFDDDGTGRYFIPTPQQIERLYDNIGLITQPLLGHLQTMLLSLEKAQESTAPDPRYPDGMGLHRDTLLTHYRLVHQSAIAIKEILEPGGKTSREL